MRQGENYIPKCVSFLQGGSRNPYEKGKARIQEKEKAFSVRGGESARASRSYGTAPGRTRGGKRRERAGPKDPASSESTRIRERVIPGKSRRSAKTRGKQPARRKTNRKKSLAPGIRKCNTYLAPSKIVLPRDTARKNARLPGASRLSKKRKKINGCDSFHSVRRWRLAHANKSGTK